MRRDPVLFVRRYAKPRDQEIAGFLASQFAYGNVKAMRQFLKALFEKLGHSPYEYVLQGDFSALAHLYYRFQKGPDIIDLFRVLNKIIREYGALGGLIEKLYRGDVRDMLWAVRKRLFGDDPVRQIFFFPKHSPSNPLKRWNLYLRWMVRQDAIDLGIWDFIPKKELIVPLDTHLFKIGRCMGWTHRRTQSWAAACDITEALKQAAPEDPLKYDFFLCHAVGMDAKCSGTKHPSCRERCVLYEVQTDQFRLRKEPCRFRVPGQQA